MEKVFASVRLSSPLPVAVARTSQSPFPDNEVHLYFMNDSTYEYLNIKGNATITQDKELIDKYWTDFANAWFDGKDDPNVTIIGVKAYDGYYYDTKDNKIFAMAKMLFAAATGAKTEDGGIEGNLTV